MPTETVQVQGHIIDSLILAKILDLIVASGADYRLVDFEVGKSNTDLSLARIEVSAGDDDTLTALLEELHAHGANAVSDANATLVPAEVDGVLPEGSYSTTNLPTSIRVNGRWIDVVNPEMDCGIIVDGDVART